MDAFEGKGPYPVEKLDDFLPLYEKVKNPKHFTKPFPATSEHDKRLTQLNELRGQFTHFTPRGWSLELVGLPEIARASVDVATWSAVESGALWYKPSHIKRTTVAARRIVRLTNKRV